MKSWRIHELARREAIQATLWYAERNPSAARRFRDELLQGFSNAAAFPSLHRLFARHAPNPAAKVSLLHRILRLARRGLCCCRRSRQAATRLLAKANLKGPWKAELISRYNLSMSRTAAELLEEARQLPPGDFDWLIQNLLSEGDEGSEEKRFVAWQKEVGEPEPGYEEWFRAGVEEARADTSGDVSHEEAMKHFHQAILDARKIKATA